MDLVDGDRLAPGVGVAPIVAMRLVAPFMRKRRRRYGSGGGPQLRAEGERVRLERQAHALRADDLVLVKPARAEVGNENLPHAGVSTQAHGMPAAIPVIEVADHGNAFRVRSPDSEMHAAGAFMIDQMGTQLVEEPQMRAF